MISSPFGAQARIPSAGSVLELVEIVPAPIAGQGIAWDPAESDLLYGILKHQNQVVVARPVPVD